jgi:hypothetical protein
MPCNENSKGENKMDGNGIKVCHGNGMEKRTVLVLYNVHNIMKFIELLQSANSRGL